MSAPRAAAQLLRMPVSLAHAFRPLQRGGTAAGTAQRAVPTIALNTYVADQNRLVACSTHPEESSMKYSG